MKLLAGFSAVCLLMFAVIAWQIGVHWRTAPPNDDVESGVAAGQPLARTSPAIPDSGENAVTQAVVPAIAAPGHEMAGPAPHVPGSTTSAAAASAPGNPVHWARTPEQREARRRLERSYQVLRTDPDHEGALHDQLAALIELQRWSEAADTLARLVRLHPDDNGQRFEHATLLMQARRWTDTIEVLKDVVAREPQNARAWFNLATSHQAVGHLADARTAWDRAIDLTPTAAARARRGEVLLDQHEWALAATEFARVLEEEPDSTDAVLNLALALYRDGRTGEAQGRLLGFVERRPREVPVLARLAQLAWQQYESQPAETRRSAQRMEAIQWCRKALAVNPEQPDVRALLAAAEAARP